MGKIQTAVFMDASGGSKAEGLVSLLEAAIEITKAHAGSSSERKSIGDKPADELPEILETTFNKLKKIADANKVE